MSQLKRYNGSIWENVGGNVAPKTAKTTSNTDTYSCNYINTIPIIKSADITGTTNANGEVDLTTFNSNFTPSKIVIVGVKVTNSIYYVTTNSAGTTLFVGFRNRGTSYSPVANGTSMSFTIYYIEI